VPPAVLARKKKEFGIPISTWLKKWPIPDRGRTADMGMDFAALSKNGAIISVVRRITGGHKSKWLHLHHGTHYRGSYHVAFCNSFTEATWD